MSIVANNPIWYSHSRQEANRRVGSKKLHDHIHGVTQKALGAFYQGFEVLFSTQECLKLLEHICQLHDLGKYLPDFQDYLLDRPGFDRQLKQHAAFGAQVLWQYWQPQNTYLAVVGWVLVLKHHGNLPSWEALPQWMADPTHKSVFTRQKDTLLPNIEHVVKDLGFEALPDCLEWPQKYDLLDTVDEWADSQDIRRYFLVNYLFSLLIEADKLDATDTKVYSLVHIKPDLVNQFIAQIQKGQPATEQNQKRQKARQTVLQHLQDPSILQRRLFTLTAPTGLGKTLMALDFCLKLKANIQQEQGYEPQIIYALPFINIIEQSLKVYEKVLGPNVKVLAHYQYADVFGTSENKQRVNELAQADLEQLVQRQQMALDTWQADVVITSFVQLLQTMVGNRNKMLKKFQHLAGSILILDEVQNIDLQKLPLLGAVFYWLANTLDVRIIVMTATRPKIYELAEKHIFTNKPSLFINNNAPLELLSNYKTYFRALKRTQLVLQLEEVCSTDVWVDLFFDTWQEEQSALLVCNTVGRSLQLFQALQASIDDAERLYYLSTNLLPIHRQAVKEKVKEALDNGEKPVLVSTQCVEAGVDLDFDLGYRDLGPLDSIIQVAGRVNRNDDVVRRGAPLYIVNTGDCEKIYGKLTQQQVEKALLKAVEKYPEGIPEQAYLDLVETYFDDISNKSSFSESQEVYEAMEYLRYESTEHKKGVNSFKVINDDLPTMTIFIEVDEEGIQARQAYEQLLQGQLSREQYDLHHKRNFQQRILAVSAFLNKCNDLKQMPNTQLSEDLWCVSNAFCHDFYKELTGFDRTTAEDEEKASFL